MPSAYFDTTVYDSIARQTAASEDVDAVTRVVKRGALRAYPSLVNIEELLGQWESDPDAVIRRIAALRELVGLDAILKRPTELVSDAVHAYAEDRPTGAIVLPAAHRDVYAAQLERLARGDVRFDVSSIVAGVRALKDFVTTLMADTREATLADFRAVTRDELRALTFDQFFDGDRGARRWAEAYADRIGVGHVCRTRGLDGLLNVRPLRMYIGAQMSLVYAQVVGDGVQSRRPRRGDAYDLWHAVNASVGDIFVTGDEQLAQQLKRIPMERFTVVTSLRELLELPEIARLR